MAESYLLIEFHSTQDPAATVRHGITRIIRKQEKKHIGKLKEHINFALEIFKIKTISEFSCKKETVDKNILKTGTMAENHATYKDNEYTSHESNTSKSNIHRKEAGSYPAHE